MSKPFEIILKPTHTDAQITPDRRLIHVKRVSEKTYSEIYGQFLKKIDRSINEIRFVRNRSIITIEYVQWRRVV